MQNAAQWSAALTTVLDTNGKLGVGLGVGTDNAAPIALRIPVPKNISSAKLAIDRERIASWAANKVTGTTPIEVLRKHSFYAVWITGLVQYHPRQSDVPDSITTFAQVGGLDWDAEVNVLDEDVTNLGQKDLQAGEQLFVPDPVALARAATLIAAAKVTWHATRHHLGSTIDGGAAGRARYGLAEKVIKSWNDASLTLDDPTIRDSIHTIVHPCSTIGIIRLLAESVMSKHHPQSICTDVDIRRGLRVTRDALYRRISDAAIAQNAAAAILGLPTTVDNRSDQQNALCLLLSGGSFRRVAVVPLSVGNDILLRIHSGGAGTRKLVDTVEAVKKIAESHIYPLLPSRGQLAPLIEGYFAVRDRPFIFGENAGYLSGAAATATVDVNPEIIAHAASFMRAVIPRSTLARAAVFMGNAEDKEGFSQTWNLTCTRYAVSLVRLASADEAVINSLIGEISVAGIPNIGDPELAALQRLAPLAPDHRARIADL